jgi:hypothetical protein
LEHSLSVGDELQGTAVLSALDGDSVITSSQQRKFDAEGEEVVYYIKWVGKSHLHNTWHTQSELESMDLKGIKKLHNYIKRMNAYKEWLCHASIEDKEYDAAQQAQVRELQVSYTTVERVIDARDNVDTGEAEYFCKWEGLPYASATWESAAVVSPKFQVHIDQYLARASSKTIPLVRAAALSKRPHFRTIEGIPPWLPHHIALRDYQLAGVNWLAKSWCRGNSVILADEMGLGKTIQTISFLSYLFHVHKVYGPFLLVGPLSTLPAWQRECAKWAPTLNTIVYLGDQKSRELIEANEFFLNGDSHRVKFNIMITSYEMMVNQADQMQQIKWAVLMVDEAQRLKSHTSALYEKLFDMDFNHCVLITGTPLQVRLSFVSAV